MAIKIIDKKDLIKSKEENFNNLYWLNKEVQKLKIKILEETEND